MRTFEWAELAIVAAAVLGPVLVGRRLKRGRAVPVLLGVVVFQWIVEGYRWQLLPLHLTAIGLAVGDVVWEERKVTGFPRFRRAVLGPVGLLLLALPLVALPVPEIPSPSGPFAIGTVKIGIVDRDREDPYPVPTEDQQAAEPGDDEDEVVEDPRRLVVQVWYPAEPEGDARPVIWNEDWDVVGPATSRALGFPWFFLDHVADVSSHSVADAAPLSGRLPVVLYSHRWAGFRSIALNQMESLASHGYVVIAPDHPHLAVTTRLPDGEVIPLDDRALPSGEGVDAGDRAEALELVVETQAEDLRTLLDELEAGTSGAFGRLADHVDLQAVGLLGHSTGGGAAVRLCLDDERCASVAGLDPVVDAIPDRLVARELEVPSLFIRSDEWRGTPNDRRLRGMAERSPSVSWWMGINGAEHNDFVLTPFLSPYAEEMGLRGPVDPRVVERALDSYLVAFFDRTLLGIGGGALDAPLLPGIDLEPLP